LNESGELAEKRRHQALAWMWTMVQEGLRARFDAHPAVKTALPQTVQAVGDARLSPAAAAQTLLDLMARSSD
jgi:LAO/AO transport system kinase